MPVAHSISLLIVLTKREGKRERERERDRRTYIVGLATMTTTVTKTIVNNIDDNSNTQLPAQDYVIANC